MNSHFSAWTRMSWKMTLGSFLGIILTLSLTLFSPVAIAAAPGSSSGSVSTATSNTASGTQYIPVDQDPTWLAAKKQYRVISGINQGLPIKGQAIQPSILAQNPTTLGTPPTAMSLSLGQNAVVTWEPSDGNSPNNGPGSSVTDDQGYHYFDHDFFDLCGPGAADIALDFWPAPPNLIAADVSDLAYNSYTSTVQHTFWNGTKMRGYMMYLAWNMQAPSWLTSGMMDVGHYPSYGVTNWTMRDALNWEASGENAGNWQSYFYTVAWWNENNSPTYLHASVVSDVWRSGVPVVAEVNAAMLPNWNLPGQMIHHYITIIGYDDVAGTYSYTDTCGASTRCNPSNANFDGNVKTVSQATMWNAITSIPVKKSTDASAGDGGWIW